MRNEIIATITAKVRILIMKFLSIMCIGENLLLIIPGCWILITGRLY
jgi:hypothetical protein